MNKQNFGHISYVFLLLEKRYKLRFNQYLLEYQMAINLGELWWLRDGHYKPFPLSVRDISTDYPLEAADYSLEDFSRQLESNVS